MNTTGDTKKEVRLFWNAQSCDTQVARARKFTHEYFDEIENFRYLDQPFIHSFAQFTRLHNSRVLEVGFGAGTDFIQWLRAGARVSGIDLTQEAVENVQHRIKVYDLPSPEVLQVADAEQLPFQSDTYDLGYSFGVLHHTPDTERALSELVRVIRPGGKLKVMLYNRRSIYVINRWVRFALLKGKPWRTLRWVLWHTIENTGTKGYTRGELVKMLTELPLSNVQIHTEVTSGDQLSSSAFTPLNWLYRIALWVAGTRYDWDLSQYVLRTNDPVEVRARRQSDALRPTRPVKTGNPLGFYHCITAEKR